MRPHPRRARTDARSPRAWGTSDRNGMIGNQENLVWQYEWGGTQLYNKKILVHPDEYDTPQRQLGTIILPPDPVSILNARPEPYYVEEQTMRLQMDGQVRKQMDGQVRLESNLQNTAKVYVTESAAEDYVIENDPSIPYGVVPPLSFTPT